LLPDRKTNLGLLFFVRDSREDLQQSGDVIAPGTTNAWWLIQWSRRFAFPRLSSLDISRPKLQLAGLPQVD